MSNKKTKDITDVVESEVTEKDLEARKFNKYEVISTVLHNKKKYPKGIIISKDKIPDDFPKECLKDV